MVTFEEISEDKPLSTDAIRDSLQESDAEPLIQGHGALWQVGKLEEAGCQFARTALLNPDGVPFRNIEEPR